MFKEALQSLTGKNKEVKERFKEAQVEDRINRTVEDRKKSSNERELERYMKEEREKEIKNQLEYFRKKKEKEINYGHNPLNVKNVTNKCDWEVLKEQNLFNKNKNIFKNQKRIY